MRGPGRGRVAATVVAALATATLAGCAGGPFGPVASEGAVVGTRVTSGPGGGLVAEAAVPLGLGRSAARVPWQLMPASSASIAKGETTIEVEDPTYGRVKGTASAVRRLREPVVPFTTQTRTVAACGRTIGDQAKGLGAYSVQAASAGPNRTRRDGTKVQQVFFRIIYQRPDGIEVRQAQLRCRVDARERVVEATPV